jgi:hypothetical protein
MSFPSASSHHAQNNAVDESAQSQNQVGTSSFICSCKETFSSKRKCIEHFRDNYRIGGHIMTCSCTGEHLLNMTEIKNHCHKESLGSFNSTPSSSDDALNSNFVAGFIRDLQGTYNTNEKTCLFVIKRLGDFLNANNVNAEFLKKFSSQRKIENKLVSDGVYIKPKQGHSEVCGNYSYIPSKELFQFLLLHPQTSQWFVTPYKSNAVNGYEDFCDGQRYEGVSHSLKEKMKRNFFHIVLYADFIELSNPLGSKAGNKGKVCLFLVTFMNFPPWYRSKTKYLFFVACGSKDISLNNVAKEIVLGDFLSFLTQLHNGITLKLPNNKEDVFYGTVRTVVGDLQMLYDIHGLKLSFGPKGSSGCFVCKTPNNKFNLIHDPNVYPFKDNSYFSNAMTDILLAEDEKAKELVMKNLGVRERSLLDNIDGFSIVLDTMIDIMHVKFEGLCPKMFHYVFQQFYHKLKWVSSIQILSDAFVNFNYHPTIQKSDLPKLKNFPKNKPKCHSAMMMNMVLHMPIILSEFVQDENEPVVQLYLLFVRIIQFSLSPFIRESDLSSFEEALANFQKIANSLMEPQLYLKFHLLNHLTRQIRNWGPLVRHWGMRFESKNSTAKQRLSKNFKNVPLSTAKTYSFKMSSDFYDEKCSPLITMESQTFEINQIIVKAVVRGVSYESGTFINIGQQEKAVIVEITNILKSNEAIKFECDLFSGKYCTILNAFEVPYTSAGKSKPVIVDPLSLKSPFPLWNYEINGKQMIIGKCVF